jgi:hypothetical protein
MKLCKECERLQQSMENRKLFYWNPRNYTIEKIRFAVKIRLNNKKEKKTDFRN